MNPLEAELREMIADEGPISVERYMQLCLQHPHHGYYTTREAIGRDGDFVTAPEVDQMFGELIGLWAAAVWIGMGAPRKIRLVELGPGCGTLMADALRATRIVPGFREAMRVDLVETSPRLEKQQREKLRGASGRTAWHRTIDALPDGPAIIIANEFLDALPVRQYARGPDGWHERLVGLGDDGGLVFGLDRAAMALEVKTLESAALAADPGMPGQLLEVGHVAIHTVADLASRVAVQGGALLVCDYGHAATSFGETLQAMRDHAYADVLRHPGEADLTAHVDFAALGRVAEAAGAAVHGPLAQGVFLTNLGIAARAARLKRDANAAQAASIDAALVRFTDPGSSMATLFKVLAVTPVDAPAPPGFAEIA